MCTENFGMLEFHTDIRILATLETHHQFLNRPLEVKFGFIGEGSIRCLIFLLMENVITECPPPPPFSLCLEGRSEVKASSKGVSIWCIVNFLGQYWPFQLTSLDLK